MRFLLIRAEPIPRLTSHSSLVGVAMHGGWFEYQVLKKLQMKSHCYCYKCSEWASSIKKIN
jgi:hypothetical protein